MLAAEFDLQNSKWTWSTEVKVKFCRRDTAVICIYEEVGIIVGSIIIFGGVEVSINFLKRGA
jgi:hypothetical protein